jgi:erythritol transport system permease protein
MAVANTLTRPDRMASFSSRALLTVLKGRALLVLVLLVVVFSALAPSFLTANSFLILSKHIAILAILATGMTFVVLTGGIDLSVGSIVGLSGMIAGYVLKSGVDGHPGSVLKAALLAMLTALAVGAINGLLVARAGVAPFIATLGTLYMARGAALLLSGGKTFPNLAANLSSFTLIGQGSLLRVPLPVWMTAGLVGVAIFVGAHTPLGRHIYAVGGNERAARLAGIEINRVKMVTYLFSAFCASLVGLIIASQLEAAHPATGETFELNAIAAVVLGGTSLSGGRGSVAGSLIGACVIGVLADGLVMLGVSEFWQIVVKGAVIVLAVAVDQFQAHVQARLLPYLMRSDAEAGA